MFIRNTRRSKKDLSRILDLRRSNASRPIPSGKVYKRKSKNRKEDNNY